MISRNVVVVLGLEYVPIGYSPVQLSVDYHLTYQEIYLFKQMESQYTEQHQDHGAHKHFDNKAFKFEAPITINHIDVCTVSKDNLEKDYAPVNPLMLPEHRKPKIETLHFQSFSQIAEFQKLKTQEEKAMKDNIRACFRDLEDNESPEYSAEKLGLDKRIPKKR